LTLYATYSLFRWNVVADFIAPIDEWWLVVFLIKAVVFVFAFFIIQFLIFPYFPFLVLIVTLIAIFVGMVIDFMLIRPVTKLLTLKYLKKWIKLISLLLLLTGFHFDLLAS